MDKRDREIIIRLDDLNSEIPGTINKTPFSYTMGIHVNKTHP